MHIYLLRHGIAEPGSPSHHDSERDLTADGRHGVKAVAKLAARAGVKPDLIISSPYQRALATARIAAEVFGYRDDVDQSRTLTPENSPEAVWEEVRVHRDRGSVMLVGHEPLFSTLGSYLLGGNVLIEFKKAAILCIEMERLGTHPRGILNWMITPKLAG